MARSHQPSILDQIETCVMKNVIISIQLPRRNGEDSHVLRRIRQHSIAPPKHKNSPAFLTMVGEWGGAVVIRVVR